jgi:predicted ATPase
MRSLPSGTVTFLFTDMEGSTRLLQSLGPERYAEVLGDYRRVIRGACARNGGAEVDAQGDGLFFAFPTAPAALAAARGVTDALEAGPTRVRVGVHTGTPLLTDEGYVGVDVHRAARIAAAAHGGQVIVSESTAELAGERLGSLGEHRLRDLLEPLRLFQLGDGVFPAPRSLGSANLPVQPTPFLGRERELAEALGLLRDPQTRMLTLTGAGGSGKTRLALQTAAEAVGDFPDGVFWVPLQALHDPALVVPTIVQSLAAREDTPSKRMLLVLDNFEQVIPAASQAGDLCMRLAGSKFLVTSRERLQLAMEREYPVPPLPEREAVAFFAERARAIKPDFVEDAIALEICRRLDGLPLALELAAARIKVLSPADLLVRLDRRLPLLTGGPRDAPARQQTLRATIAWSHELLTPAARRLFARLAVFTGGCTLEATEDVCEADLDTVSELVEKSLLRREGQRYAMLETIAEYAAERLAETGELPDLRRRHAEYYLGMARSIENLIRSPQAAALLDRLESDHDNLRAALDWLSQGTPDRALRLAVWGLAGRLHGFGDLALDRDDTAEAARLYRESLEIGRELGDELQTAYALAGLAAVGAKLGKRHLAARLWGSVRRYEDTTGTLLHDAERARYARLLDEFEQALTKPSDFGLGEQMTLDEAVEYALSSTE